MNDEGRDEGAWLRPSEAAKLAGVGRTTMYRWLERLAREGVLVRKLGPQTTLIERASLEAWLAQRELPPTPAQPTKRRGRKPSGWWDRVRKSEKGDATNDE